mmetsp:Transcript_26158/g.53803  ORF Transcript_26158/g.53803 Transcript_26158/m.53803 type:complete len:80 (+) Transcript_26158:183-422(+)
MPTETAGFKDPPEIPPIAKPPTVTQEPIRSPNIWELFVLDDTATQRTTKLSRKVKIVSATTTCDHVLPATGPSGKDCPT